ncbi:FkbM family methyltransferase [Oscillatoria sp. FACHB-1407]|uniref:FkbM family methyltransferase n=1 Tax=Oscillatoria sp. FACHB-1407 TaxID=2692847 RepID=UPI001688A379|nr:FkbM family methyltransferase [Oscillatoria sp. FACHB-1407]MBD2462313.1 FkbM family methyltransferase [Oscillatoria sp. FACHB-1407]
MPIFLPILKSSGQLNQLHITVCNVGSRKINTQDDYASVGWNIFAPNLTIYGFDADPEACDAANADLEARQVNWIEKHVPLALSNAPGESTLYVTQHPMCSSLYPPNEPYLSRFSGLPELVNLDFTVEIETTTLDEFCQQEAVTDIDFLQIDVQGADLLVLQGGQNLLERSVLAVQIEVEFSPLYSNQPLFSDVDTFLRSRDFSLFHLASSHRVRMRSPIQSFSHPGQLLWADAFYFRDLLRSDFDRTQLKTPEQLFKLACIADVMDFPDYALELLEALTLQYGDNPDYNCADAIVMGLANFSELKAQGLEQLPIVENVRQYLSDSAIALLKS